MRKEERRNKPSTYLLKVVFGLLFLITVHQKLDMMSKANLIRTSFLFVFPIVVVIYFYYGGSSMERRDIKNYKNFNAANINDHILDKDYYGRAIRLKFENQTLVFYPKTSLINQNNNFYNLAQKGDLITKKSFQDTVTLKKKNGEIYKYTFYKFEHK